LRLPAMESVVRGYPMKDMTCFTRV
jgi:hypothetical protein